MGTWTEFDPFTGVTETNVCDEDTGKIMVHKSQDVEDLLDATKGIANSRATDIGIKKGFWHYCSIPLTVQYEILKKYGVNCQNRDHYPRLFSIINEHYPYLKTTHKNHSFKRAGKIYAVSNSPKS